MPNRSPDAQSRITCEPINGAKAVFREAVTIFDHTTFQKKADPPLNSFTESCLCRHRCFLSETFNNPSTKLEMCEHSE